MQCYQNRMFMKLKFLIVFFIACCLAACTHNNDTYFQPLDATLKQKFNFQKGSYWIYKDSLTGVEDSFVSVEDTITRSSPTSRNDIYEYLTVVITAYGTPGCSIGYYFYGGDGYHIGAQLANNLIEPYYYSVAYPFTNYHFSSGTDITSDTILSTPYTLAGNTFYNVVQLFYGQTSNHDNDKLCYINDSVGFIKMRLPYQDASGKSVKVLELQRWHIIK